MFDFSVNLAALVAESLFCTVRFWSADEFGVQDTGKGHYFLRRRLGFAFQRRSVRMQTDRMRTQRLMLMISALLAVLVMVGALVVGWLRPAGLVNDSKIVADRKLGTVSCRWTAGSIRP